MIQLSLESEIVASGEQVSSMLGDEAVILQVNDGIYYGLDTVGATVWDLLQQPCTILEIRDRILSEYDVDAERCERDLLLLLQTLAERRLVEVSEPALRDS